MRTYHMGTGFMGVGKNKGAIGSWFEISGLKCLFANAHLDSGQAAVEKRNQSLSLILKDFQLRHGDVDLMLLAGDLNYRLDFDNTERVCNLIRQGEFKTLLSADQLTKQIAAARVKSDDDDDDTDDVARLTKCMKMLREPQITFPPTYKLVPMTNEYSVNEKNGKVRMPAWCDRILYVVSPNAEASKVSNIFYTATPLYSSDHKPVSALYRVVIDEDI
eukprot:CAMPEP_0185277210 /NCGR_PEP_ID=MMETSP1359-20130426/58080_1 /TAXON_ID=552665 /ORGANISM="Bigelowiella longifila, Strain CCMP242" /LENGTH=217 /DNA_ID=CAMNT_0027871239 /DNA_START=122 /DNA_END=775 /DNA_ORIENTATION=+